MAARVVAQGLIEGAPNSRTHRWRCVGLTARGCRLGMPAYRIERATVALGGVAEGTVQTVSRRSKLPEYAATSGDWNAHVEAMRMALATFGKSARRAIEEATDLKDADTADLFTEVSRGIDKLLWMVEAHVQQ